MKVLDTPTIRRVNQVPGVSEASDLCVRAAQLLQTYCGCRQGVEILVEKNIPLGGGLGGGSSDGATVLLALNQLWQLHLDRDTLIQLGLQLGADVPFFLFGTNAWVEGIGELLQPIALKNASYVVLTPEVHVSTAEIFANKELTKNTKVQIMSGFSGTAQRGTDQLISGNVKAEFINDLEKIVCANYPEVADCLSWLKQYGDARMSGSGASVFLEAPNMEIATRIFENKPDKMRGFVAKGLNQHPLKDFAA